MTAHRAIKAVVFDLDGLMLNTEDVFELAGVECWLAAVCR